MGLKAKIIGGLAVTFAAVAGLGYMLQDFTYSDGARVGVITKFSHKGILCRTWEGQQAQLNISRDGSRSAQNQGLDNTFYFSVENEEVAQQIRDAMNSGATVSLEYEQKLFSLSWPFPGLCQRRTEYEITGVRRLNVAPGTVAPTPPQLP